VDEAELPHALFDGPEHLVEHVERVRHLCARHVERRLDLDEVAESGVAVLAEQHALLHPQNPASRCGDWPDRVGTLAVFFANGLGLAAAAIPALKARLALSDGQLSVALLGFACGAFISMPLAGCIGARVRTGHGPVAIGTVATAANLSWGMAVLAVAVDGCDWPPIERNASTDCFSSPKENAWGRVLAKPASTRLWHN
jgi:hypothetical protein